MEFIPIKISQQGQHPHSELSFKSDCTEIKCISNGRFYGHITNMQTYCSQDVSKEQNLIFPTKIIKFFKLLSSSEFGRRFWFDGCSRGNFNEAGIDTNYDADVGDIFSGDSKSDFMRYIYRDMVVPFTELEKENNHLRGQLERKDQELAQMKEQLHTKDQELKEKDRELKEKDRELAQMEEQLHTKDQELIKTTLLTASTLNEDTLHHDRTLFGLKYVIEVNCEKLHEKDQKLKNIQEELGNIQEELDTTYQELKELQEDFETKDQELKDIKEELKDTQQELKDTQQELKDTQQELKDTQQELKDTQQELKTRGCLLKTCIDDLKTYAEEVEEVEKKNQELEHLNHRLICETSSSFIERNSYFSPEM
jgi:peptidoglycan hydrolase CwlO-like protein